MNEWPKGGVNGAVQESICFNYPLICEEDEDEFEDSEVAGNSGQDR